MLSVLMVIKLPKIVGIAKKLSIGLMMLSIMVTIRAWATPQSAETLVSRSLSTVSASPEYTNDLWQVLRQHFAWQADYSRLEVQQQVQLYLHRRTLLNHILAHAKLYLYYVYQQTQTKHFPAELALLPFVESDYQPHAYSRSGAAGIWQIMPTMASYYGLNGNWWYDPRRDATVSTKIALDHLQGLYQTWQDWPLALASYNAGTGVVRDARQKRLAQHAKADFWDLSLPTETKTYVPKLLALASIINNPSRYGITLPAIANKPYFTQVTVKRQLDWQQIADLTHCDITTLRDLNPAESRWATEPNKVTQLLIPVSKKTEFIKGLTKLHSHIIWQYHEVQQQDTLESIASNYHTSVTVLQKINELNNQTIHTNQGLLVPVYLPIKTIRHLNSKITPNKSANVLVENKLRSNNPLSTVQIDTKQLLSRKIAKQDVIKSVPPTTVSDSQNLKSLVEQLSMH